MDNTLKIYKAIKYNLLCTKDYKKYVGNQS